MGSRYMFWTIAVVMDHILMTSKVTLFQNGRLSCKKHAKMGLFQVLCVSGPPATSTGQNDLILGDMLAPYMGMMHVV